MPFNSHKISREWANKVWPPQAHVTLQLLFKTGMLYFRATAFLMSAQHSVGFTFSAAQGMPQTGKAWRSNRCIKGVWQKFYWGTKFFFGLFPKADRAKQSRERVVMRLAGQGEHGWRGWWQTEKSSEHRIIWKLSKPNSAKYFRYRKSLQKISRTVCEASH